MKTCSDCAAEAPEDDFYKHKNGSLYSRCKACHYKRTQVWRAANREKLRTLDRERYHAKYRDRKLAYHRFRKYGITAEQYEALREKQGNVCPICLNPFAESTQDGSPGDWDIASVDHCHVTGKVRGILHRRCNLALEFMLTDEERTRAAAYLAAG